MLPCCASYADVLQRLDVGEGSIIENLLTLEHAWSLWTVTFFQHHWMCQRLLWPSSTFLSSLRDLVLCMISHPPGLLDQKIMSKTYYSFLAHVTSLHLAHFMNPRANLCLLRFQRTCSFQRSSIDGSLSTVLNDVHQTLQYAFPKY